MRVPNTKRALPHAVENRLETHVHVTHKYVNIHQKTTSYIFVQIIFLTYYANAKYDIAREKKEPTTYIVNNKKILLNKIGALLNALRVL